MTLHGLCLTLVLCTALTSALIGQSPTGNRVIAQDDGARVERLAEGVYAIIHDDATQDWPSGVTEWPHGNSGLIVGNDFALVIDAGYLPSRARSDITLIRRVTDKPVRFLVNTHWHGDHTHGNAEYLKEFPGLSIIGQEANRDWIATNQARYPRLVDAGGGGKQATLTRLKSLLAAGQDSAGRRFTAAESRSLASNIRARELELEGLRAVDVAPPNVLFAERMVVELGGRRVVLENRGRANSPADVTAYVPQERILFTGDILVYPVPYVGASHPLPWIDVLKALESTPTTWLVPGHGPAMSDQAYLRLVRELFEATRDRVRAAMVEGRALDDIVRSVDLSDFRARFLRSVPEPRLAGYWEGTPAVLVERMHQCVQGYRC